MKQRMMFVLTGITALILIGCSHAGMRGSVAMKTGENEGHVCLGDKEVKVGERVNVFKNECNRGGGGKVGANERCRKVKVGEGTVNQVLNEHYSVVQFDSGVPFEEGTVIEKQK